MIDWNDVRYFLAVARERFGPRGRRAPRHQSRDSAQACRSAGRIGWGRGCSRRLPSGYHITAAGEEVLGLAEQMEASSNQLEARVIGRDQGVRGLHCG